MEFISNLFNRTIKLVIILIVILVTIFFYRENTLNYKIIKYNPSDKIFIDRDYIDNSGTVFFHDKSLIQIPRHYKKDIVIFSNSPTIIYRPTCNKNKLQYENWRIFKIELNIKGISCVHKKIYYKEFKNFFIKLKSGGPISSDPIFISFTKKDAIIKVLNFKK
jgi:hypothetical protein